jgi:hypothetical protein
MDIAEQDHLSASGVKENRGVANFVVPEALGQARPSKQRRGNQKEAKIGPILRPPGLCRQWFSIVLFFVDGSAHSTSGAGPRKTLPSHGTTIFARIASPHQHSGVGIDQNPLVATVTVIHKNDSVSHQ